MGSSHGLCPPFLHGSSIPIPIHEKVVVGNDSADLSLHLDQLHSLLRDDALVSSEVGFEVLPVENGAREGEDAFHLIVQAEEAV